MKHEVYRLKNTLKLWLPRALIHYPAGPDGPFSSNRRRQIRRTSTERSFSFSASSAFDKRQFFLWLAERIEIYLTRAMCLAASSPLGHSSAWLFLALTGSSIAASHFRDYDLVLMRVVISLFLAPAQDSFGC